uniref:Uncharacterized protein n=1 Tax=Lutzomyia longipalpis TaxID=7200 RepID=A0A1B0EYH2_LUTLO
MNSYFEQSGFYGHPHQTTGMGMTTAAHHDQSATAAYRGFPLSLGMSPYANHHLHQSRSQESPYDASISAACSKIYDGAYNKDCAKNAATGAGSGGSTETNGYKDVWNTSSSGSTGQNASVPVRPSACTPDSRAVATSMPPAVVLQAVEALVGSPAAPGMPIAPSQAPALKPPQQPYISRQITPSTPGWLSQVSTLLPFF